LIAKNLLHRFTHKNRSIITNAGSLVGSTVVTSGLGFVYWWTAAKLFPASAVGLASAMISAMNLLGTFAMLGLGTLLIKELPKHTSKTALILTALLVAAIGGILLGLIFALFAARISPELAALSADGSSVILFALGVCFTAITLVLDQALIGLLRGELQLWRNAIFAIAKLLILGLVGFGFAAKFGLDIYFTWLIGNVISLVMLGGLVAVKRTKLQSFRPDWRLLKGFGFSALGHHLLNMALIAPNMVLPLLVTIMLSATSNAHFYAAWMIAHFVFIIPSALTTALYAVGANNPDLLAQKIRFTFKMSVLAGVLTNFFLFFGADIILRFFGASYAEEAAWALRVLGLGVFPLTVKDYYVVINRLQGRLTQASVPVAFGGIFELALATIGIIWGGLLGLAVGWLVALCIEAVLMALPVYRVATPTKVKTPVALG
jgi:O-antigen/teichoic acid export membrane protein